MRSTSKYGSSSKSYHIGDFYCDNDPSVPKEFKEMGVNYIRKGMVIRVSNIYGRCVRFDSGEWDYEIEELPPTFDRELPTIEELEIFSKMTSRFLDLRSEYTNKNHSIFREKDGRPKLFPTSSSAKDVPGSRIFYDLENKRRIVATKSRYGWEADFGEIGHFYRIFMFSFNNSEYEYKQTSHGEKRNGNHEKKASSSNSHGGCGIIIFLLLIIAAVVGVFYYYQQRQNTMTASSWFDEDEFSDESVADYETPTSTAIDEISDSTSTVDDEIFYYNVDVSPDFPGSGEGLLQFIRDNLVYPQSAIDNNITGTVHVTFVIEKNGHRNRT